MTGKQDKKQPSPDSSDEDQTPDAGKNKPSFTEERSKTEVEALEAMLKKEGRRPQWDPLPGKSEK